ncbi:CsbD family protein [Enterococcus nangangensis]|uniref:CsbD family protein n=1 Tax=Enterococcus nangangensis TaxID=2559926 RepID=UPI0010F65841|nr:CsbD family protein [Enterococcus nangangensis]
MSDKGILDQAKGKAKEIIGDLTGDDKKKAEGQVEQLEGKAKGAMENLSQEAREKALMAQEAANKALEKAKSRFKDDK